MSSPRAKSIGIPKEMTQLMIDGDQDMKDMQAKLSKLRALSADDKTENALLRSRIEEQSELIMILKQRTDESILRIRALESMNSDYETRTESAADERRRVEKKYQLLDQRFSDLAANHEEMIKIKDDYKRRNAAYVEENNKLKDENAKLFSAAILERDEQIRTQQEKMHELSQHDAQTLISEREAKMREREEKSMDVIKKNQEDIRELQERLKASQAKSIDMEKIRGNMDVEYERKMTKLRKEKDEMLDLAMQRGKLLQDRQSDICRLEAKITAVEQELREAKQRFEREAAAVSASLQVRKLKQELEQASAAQRDVYREFDAYKKHTSSLLQKEKDLNAKLRLLAG